MPGGGKKGKKRQKPPQQEQQGESVQAVPSEVDFPSLSGPGNIRPQIRSESDFPTLGPATRSPVPVAPTSAQNIGRSPHQLPKETQVSGIYAYHLIFFTYILIESCWKIRESRKYIHVCVNRKFFNYILHNLRIVYF